MSGAEGLLDCPFCGAHPCEMPQNTPFMSRKDKDVFTACIWCENCDILGPERDTGVEAAEAWNRRRTPPLASTGLGISYVVDRWNGIWYFGLKSIDRASATPFETDTEAMAAAQADYTARILSALVSGTKGEGLADELGVSVDWLLNEEPSK